jgi:hypothetical protein
MSYTTQDLIEILDQELRAHWKGERLLLSSEQRLDDPVLAKAVGAGQLSKVFGYRDFQGQIHQYQRDHGVSGLIWRTHQFQHHSVRSPELHSQLIAIPSDKDILMTETATVLDFWHRVTPGLSFWRAAPDPEPITPEQVQHWIQQTEWAEIEAARTELYLNLCWGTPGECHYQWAQPESGCIRVIAAIAQPGLIQM